METSPSSGGSFWNTLPLCEKDNLHIYELGGKGETNFGTVKCDTLDTTQTEIFIWKWNNIEATELQRITPTDTFVATDVKLTATGLTLNQVIPNSSFDYLIVTMVKQ